MAAKVFRRAVDYRVDAHRDGPLVDRRSEGIIQHRHQAEFPSLFDDAGDVDDLKVGVGGRFKIDEAGLGTDKRVEVVKPLDSGDKLDLDPMAFGEEWRRKFKVCP